MVVDGTADICFQPILGAGGPWDFAVLGLIVEEAGGRFSDLTGNWDIYNGGPVVFSNEVLHGDALPFLQP